MDIFEKANRAFGSWYEGLFGASEDVRPKDVLRKILAAMDENRKEGFDNHVYVPNRYILEISVGDDEERDFILSFLDQDELETAVTRYCQQNGYSIRGPLDFTIVELEPDPSDTKREKVRVKCRYSPRTANEVQARAAEPVDESPIGESLLNPLLRASQDDEDNPTVYETRSNASDELGTVPGVPFARLEIYPADEPSRELSIGPSAMIGRSRRAGNDIVFASDGMVSRRHARIEMEPDGHFTVYDLDTTNGTYVNGEKVQNRALSDGDEIRIGSTKIVFRQEQILSALGAVGGGNSEYRNGSGSNGHASTSSTPAASRARLVLEASGEPIDEYLLGGETVIGRGVTNDIVLADRAVAVRHVKIQRGSPWTIEALDGNAVALLNNQPLTVANPAKLAHGDELALGPVTLRFEEVAE